MLMADDKTTKTPGQPVRIPGRTRKRLPLPKRAGEGFRFPGAGKKDGTGGKEPAGFRL